MKKINKKGFTLIELLAVIVVLAIILVIAVPRILDVIESARKESLGRSAQMVANYLQKDSAIRMLASDFTVPSEFTDCPADAGFAEPAEGDCQYFASLTGTEASFTVRITGAGKFEGWTAESTNGETPTISITIPK